MDKMGKFEVTELDNGTLKVSHDSINDKTVKAPEGTTLDVNGVWYVDNLPSHCIVELADGSLAKFYITPFRSIVDKDLTVYKGYHPRKMKGTPLPDYLYRFYGLSRNDESLSETIRLRLAPSEKEKLEAYCDNLEPRKSVSELLRDYVRSLI